MQPCPNCGYENADGARHCLRCSGVLGPVCPACGHLVPPGSRFCNQCGTLLIRTQSLRDDRAHRESSELPPAPMPGHPSDRVQAASVAHERRQVATILFLDLVNFTATAHSLDSEDVYLFIDEAMGLLSDVVYKYEGIIDKYTGDGLMALFGAPVAHENDPERAVRAGLEMHSVLDPLRSRLKETYGFDLRARVGINSGTVVAGKVGGDAHMEYTVIGDAVNLASRLQSVADPGSVVVSLSTYRGTRAFFRYKALPPLDVKGRPHPVRAFQALGLRARTGRVRGLPGTHVPMIGRKDALIRLRSTMAEVARHRRTKVALISGEAGVGKSRLVDELRRSFAHSGVSFYQGSCVAHSRSRPLSLVADMLRDVVHVAETDPADVQHERLHHYLTQLGLLKSDSLPYHYLASVLGLAPADPKIESRLRHLDSSVLQKLTYATLRQTLLAEAALAPTVLVFEDLHWVDAASRDFLEHLIHTVENVPLMIVLVTREAERATVVKPLVMAAASTDSLPVDMQLKPLSQIEGLALVDHLLEPASGEVRELMRRIVERAEGNPFYIEEIVRMLIDQGGLRREEGAWRTTSGANVLLQGVPESLNGLILARFDRLPDDQRRVLQNAAVLGASFPLMLLYELGNGDPETTAIHLNALESRQFLHSSHLGAQRICAFTHSLFQEVLYNTLLKRDRQKKHQQVAVVIEQGAFLLPDERVEVLAYHYAESTHPKKAIPYLVAAADNALRRCANDVAIQRYGRALELVHGQGGGDIEDVVRAEVGLGQALKFTGEYARASQSLGEGLRLLHSWNVTTDSMTLLPLLVQALRELADVRVREGATEEAAGHLQAGLDVLGPAGAQAHPDLWRSLVDRLAWVRFRQGALDEAFSLASSAASGMDTEVGDDPIVLASLNNTLGGVCWQRGRLPEATDHVQHSLELYRGLGYAWGMAIAYTNLGILHYDRGMWSVAADYFERAYQLRRDNGYVAEQALNLNNLGLLNMAMGDHDRARQCLEESLAISQRLGDDFGIVIAENGLADLAVVQSQFEDAGAHVERALARSEAAGDDQAIHARWLLALVRAATGDLSGGIETAGQALQMARNAGLKEVEADCCRVLGVLHRKAGNCSEAESLLNRSAELCSELNLPYGHGLALLEMGYCYQHLARTQVAEGAVWSTRALEAVTQAARRFELLGAAYDLQRARVAIDHLQTAQSTQARAGSSQSR